MANLQKDLGAALRRRYLLLDQRIVDRVENATLRVCRAEKDKGNPLLKEDQPWEARYDNLYPTVRRDPSSGLYQCWYSPFIVDEAVRNTPAAERTKTRYKARRREMGVCYAESRDGIAWTKPELGLVEFEGSTKNNLVVRGPHGAGVYFDPHEIDATRRYKMLYADRGICGAFSPDGKHWGEAIRFPEIEAVGDTHNNAIWVSSFGKYVGITRLWDRAAKQRLMARTESSDFTNWTKAVEVMRAEPRTPDSQPYSMPIFEHEGVFLGLVTMFHVPTDTVQTELAWSPDTVRWERIDAGSPVLALGPAGSPDSGCAYAAAPVFGKDEIRIYYGASNGPHSGWRDGFFCLARMRPDGFAAFQPSSAGSPGVVVTRPLRVASEDLRINADARGGRLRVGVLESEGGSGQLSLNQAVPIGTDVLDGSCHWKKGSLRSLVGKEVQFICELHAARAFSFRFA
jgi:hypothetical protein